MDFTFTEEQRMMAAALRENLKRRKAQKRGRTNDAGAATDRPADASPSSAKREG